MLDLRNNFVSRLGRVAMALAVCPLSPSARAAAAHFADEGVELEVPDHGSDFDDDPGVAVEGAAGEDPFADAVPLSPPRPRPPPLPHDSDDCSSLSGSESDEDHRRPTRKRTAERVPDDIDFEAAELRLVCDAPWRRVVM